MLVDLLKKIDYNAKITEIEGRIPSITGLTTTAGLYSVENKKPNASNLVKKKIDYDTKISDIEFKYFTKSDYNKFRNEIIHNKIKEIEVVKKIPFFWIHK